MRGKEYQALALRTKADQAVIRERIYNYGVVATQLDNAARGLADDAGEVSAAVKKWLEYGQPLDEVNLIEEVGDCLWRLAQVCDAIGCTIEDAMEANILKLKKRYKDEYSDFQAAEENRDRVAERTAVKDGISQNGHGHGEPPEESDLDDILPYPPLCAIYDNNEVGTGRTVVEEPIASFGDGLRRKDLNESYDRYCVQCNRNPVHRSNSTGVCPDCFAKNKAQESNA